jgi:alpha-amylase
LNYLRSETFKNILRAEKLVNEQLLEEYPLLYEERDFDFDGSPEIALQNKWHRLFIQPHKGGRIVEWDYYPVPVNLLDTLCRRPEMYHTIIQEASTAGGDSGVISIHDSSKVHDITLKDYLIYDPYERKSFLEHILTGEVSPTALRRNTAPEIESLPCAEYSSQIQKQKQALSLILTASHSIMVNGIPQLLTIEKTLTIRRTTPDLTVLYRFSNTGENPIDTKAGLEWNFALLAGYADDRYYFFEDRQKAGNLVSEIDRESVTSIGLADEWQRMKIIFTFAEPVRVCTFPIETISQSESAYEKVYQSSVVYPIIPIVLAPKEEKRFHFTINVIQF